MGWIVTIVIVIILLALIVVAARLTLFTVEQQSFAIVERLGKYKKIAGPGLNVKTPLIERIAGRISIRVSQLEVEVKTKTKDNVITDIGIAIQYFVEKENVKDAFYKLQNPYKQMESYVFNTVRAHVPKMTLDEVFERKDDIAKEINESLSGTMQEFGYSIHAALVNDIRPDQKVAHAMNEINLQQRMQEAAKFEGEAKKIFVVKAAEAKRQAGIGIANQRKEITKGWQEAIANMSKGLTVDPREVMSLMVMTQHYDVMSELAKSSHEKVVFVPYTPGGVADMRAQIMQALESNAAEEADMPEKK
jgi:regulator of protease activity HflC (stomatin/prohibitin superfamily)